MNVEALVRELRARAAQGPLLVVGAGSGLTARGAAEGGADLLACYATAVTRLEGLPSAFAFLPYGDANEIMLGALPTVISAAGTTPVIAGIGAHDPRRRLERVLDEVGSAGAVGVTNEPFIGMYQGDLRRELEAAGLGFQREVDLVAAAVAHGLLGLGWSWSPEDALRMVGAGAQLIGAMLGITAAPERRTRPAQELGESLDLLSRTVEAAKAERSEVLVLIHGGALNDPGTVARALATTGADGYVAGSTVERVPVLRAVSAAVRDFKNL